MGGFWSLQFSFLALIYAPACPFPGATGGPDSYGYLFRNWLPAKALPLLARAAFAIEVTGVMGKEMAAAAGGLNCFTAPSAYSNQSWHRPVALQGDTLTFYFPL